MMSGFQTLSHSFISLVTSKSVPGLLVSIGILAAGVGCVRDFTVRGTVIDSETGEPVADARVIASYWTATILVFDSSPKVQRGTQTDSSGRFHLTGKVDYLVGDVHVQAATPNGMYGFTNHWLRGGDLVVSPRTWQTNASCFYETFDGRWAGDVIVVPNGYATGHTFHPRAAPSGWEVFKSSK